MEGFKKVFLVDDDEIFRMITVTEMNDLKFGDEIIEFEDGLHVYEYLSTKSSSDFPDLMIVDINMNMMDGWELLDSIKDIKDISLITIYIASSSINAHDLEKARNNALVTDFISKPIIEKDLQRIYLDRK